MKLETNVTCPKCGNPDLEFINSTSSSGTFAVSIVDCPDHGQYSIEVVMRLHERRSKPKGRPVK